MEVNEARIRTNEKALEFAERQIKNGYSIVIIKYDDRPRYIEMGRPWLVIYG